MTSTSIRLPLRLAPVVTGAALIVVFGAVPAQADVADEHASCAGLALSDHAVHDGPGAIAAIVDEVRGATTVLGFDNTGQVMSRFAQVHAGTHAPGCEDAFLAILTEP